MAHDALVMLLVLARVLPLGWLVSAGTRGVVPLPVGLSLALSLGFAFAQSSPVPATFVPSTFALLALVARELVLGLVFGLSALTPVLAFGWAPRLAEHASGLAPFRSGPLATLYGLSAAALVLSLGAGRALVQALFASFVALPVGVDTLDRSDFALGVAQIVLHAFALALALALPLLVAQLVLELLLGLGLRAFSARDGSGALAPLRGLWLTLLSALLLAALLSQAPDAFRAGLRLGAELLRQIVR